MVAIFAAPDFAEPFGGDAGLVKGSEALVAAVELSFFAAFEAVVVIEIILIDHSFFLNDVFFFAGFDVHVRVDGLNFDVDCFCFCVHLFYY